MDAMNLPASTKKISFPSLLKLVRSEVPGINFVASDMFSWSAEDQTIYYDSKGDSPIWSLLHELGHMSHGHNEYNTDAALVRMEMEAWESAKQWAKRFGIWIDEEHIQDCMDSYRYWQHKRSLCPVCTQNGVEKLNGSYLCINCRHRWQVGSDRFCRVYRRSLDLGS